MNDILISMSSGVHLIILKEGWLIFNTDSVRDRRKPPTFPLTVGKEDVITSTTLF